MNSEMVLYRACITLQGGNQWCYRSVSALLKNLENKKIVIVSDTDLDGMPRIERSQVRNYLGNEFDIVIFDGMKPFSADNLGIILGTVKAGGTFILLLSDTCESSLWMRRFQQVIADFEHQYESFTMIRAGDGLPALTFPEQQKFSDSIYQTEDQQQAVTAILKVVYGHRRRPLVLSSDRGRGKSASLGIAAAQLINEGKKSIVVTAPSLAIAETVFEHARRLLPEAEVTRGRISVNDAKIQFVAPDALIESQLKADVLLVDEAAAIPASMLEDLLRLYSRLVFATTLHGYEGTGRGFSVRFQQILQQNTPNWHHYRMEMPIRWAANDPLEKFSFNALLLDAEPVADELIIDAQTELCSFEKCDRDQLLNDEQSLRELFGLMVLAHYRTRPSDLQMMLDREDVTVYAMRYKGHIVASAWLVKEGGLNDDLAVSIHAGQRRLKGHLLPQSLLAHVGITTAGALNYQRITRIAVHPAIQQRGIGDALLQQIHVVAVKNSVDIVGASFGVSSELLTFWSHSGFVPVRLGIHHGDVTGSHSVMLLQGTSPKGQVVIDESRKRFQQQWPYLLSTQFKQLDADLVISLSQLLALPEVVISQWDRQDIAAFSHAHRGYEFSQAALRLWMPSRICHPDFLQLTKQQQQLCVMTLFQQREWSDVAKRLAYTGKTQIITALREAVCLLL